MTHEMPLLWVLGPMALWAVAGLISLIPTKVPKGSLSGAIILAGFVTLLAGSLWILLHCQGGGWFPDRCVR